VGTVERLNATPGDIVGKELITYNVASDGSWFRIRFTCQVEVVSSVRVDGWQIYYTWQRGHGERVWRKRGAPAGRANLCVPDVGSPTRKRLPIPTGLAPVGRRHLPLPG